MLWARYIFQRTTALMVLLSLAYLHKSLSSGPWTASHRGPFWRKLNTGWHPLTESSLWPGWHGQRARSTLPTIPASKTWISKPLRQPSNRERILHYEKTYLTIWNSATWWTSPKQPEIRLHFNNLSCSSFFFPRIWSALARKRKEYISGSTFTPVATV